MATTGRLAGAAIAVLALSLFVSVGVASATVPGLPPTGKVILGLDGSYQTPGEFKNLTGARHPIYGTFLGWGQGYTWGMVFDRYYEKSLAGDYRMMFHIGVKRNGSEVMTPRLIARGYGDKYLLHMSKKANESGQFVYIRPMAEMNGHWNVYCAFNADGSRRNAAHSTAWYRNAFRRIALIMRGGSVATINYRLKVRGLPPLRTSAERLPRSNKVAVVWNPQGEGNPNVTGNQPKDYFPGYTFVDYVANDLYSINYNAHWRAQNSLYNTFTKRPFMVAEWGPWGKDDPAFIEAMFKWVAAHKRTKALVYFNGSGSTTFRLGNKPRSLRKYRAYASLSRYRCASCGAMTP